jgi:hypothetical protein
MLNGRLPLLLAYDIIEVKKRHLQHVGIAAGWLELPISCQNRNLIAVFIG